MAPVSRVLKLARSDEESQYVLLNVVSRGSKPLDLKIEATEGEEEYAQNLRHDKVASYKVKNCPASDSEWQAILERLFNQEPQPDIQVSATVEPGTSISVVIRKSVQGITQRLGSISIGAASGSGYNVLDWCATAVDAAADNKASAATSNVKVEELEAAVADLKRQLEELIKAKDEDETALLFKFRDLLNEKKIKIREQQKIINTTGTRNDDDSSPQEQAKSPDVQLPDRGRKAGVSRVTKRKTHPTKVEEDEVTQDDFEPMDVDKVKSEPEETEREDDTEGTASGASDDEDEDSVSENVTAKARSGSGNTSGPAQRSSAPQKTTAQPPPPRSLPFTKQSSKAPVPPAGESETESDDEL